MQSVLHFIKKKKLLEKDEKVLVAISGGRDSVALAHFLHAEGYAIALAHVNYNLRQKDALSDEMFVRNLALEWAVPLHVSSVSEKAFENRNVQETARDIRYAFFEALCQEHDYTKVATAHHAEDNLETAFLNLVRGTGIRGLAGIPAQRDRYVRPLLQTNRKEIDTYIQTHALCYREDDSNASDKYARNRVRHKLIPLLDELIENGVERTKQSLNLLESDASAVQMMAEKLLIETATGYKIDLEFVPTSSTATWVYHCIHTLGFNRTQCQDLFDGQVGAIIESDNYRATIQGQNLLVEPLLAKAKPVVIHEPGAYKSSGKHIDIRQQTFDEDSLPKTIDHVWIDAMGVQFPLTLRSWNKGERFRPLGCDYEVLVSDYLKDKKVNRLTKEQTMVLTDASDKILWLVGVQISDLVKCTSNTSTVLSMNLS